MATLALVAAACKPVPYNFTGDRKADLVWIDDAGWHDATTGSIISSPLFDPLAEDGGALVAGDYDGNGRWEAAVAVFDLPSGSAPVFTGEWRTAGGAGTFTFAPPPCEAPAGTWILQGLNVPVIGDWDGDGTTDPGWYCPVSATWVLEGRDPFVFGRPHDPDRARTDVDIPTAADHDGDGRTEPIVYRPGAAAWFVEGSDEPLARSSGWGVPVPANYDARPGDELALWSPLTHTWTIEGTLVASSGTPSPGGSQVTPMPVDVDADGYVELVELHVDQDQVTFKLPDGTALAPPTTASGAVDGPAALPGSSAQHLLISTFIEHSCTGGGDVTECPRPVVTSDLDGDLVAEPLWTSWADDTWGDAATGTTLAPVVSCDAFPGNDCMPFGGDFDGDRRWDRATVLVPLGRWFSDDGLDVSFPPPPCAPAGPPTYNRALPVPGQYDHDAATELGWYCPVDGTWTLRDTWPTAVTFGTPSPVTPSWIPPGHQTEGDWYDLPAPADYDGDGIDDLAVYRPTDGTIRTSDGTVVATGLGVGIPVPADYDGDGAADGAIWTPVRQVWTFAGGTERGPLVDVGSTQVVLPGAADHDGDGAAEPSVIVPSAPPQIGAFRVQGMPDLPLDAPGYWVTPASTPPWTRLLVIHATMLDRACQYEGFCPPDPPAAP